MSFCIIVVRSHFTKKASSWVSPIRAPSIHTFVRNWVIVCFTFAQSFSLLGSKKIHQVPFSIDSSRTKKAPNVDVFPKGGHLKLF
jgi:hypothetical protein